MHTINGILFFWCTLFIVQISYPHSRWFYELWTTIKLLDLPCFFSSLMWFFSKKKLFCEIYCFLNGQKGDLICLIALKYKIGTITEKHILEHPKSVHITPDFTCLASFRFRSQSFVTLLPKCNNKHKTLSDKVVKKFVLGVRDSRHF